MDSDPGPRRNRGLFRASRFPRPRVPEAGSSIELGHQGDPEPLRQKCALDALLLARTEGPVPHESKVWIVGGCFQGRLDCFEGTNHPTPIIQITAPLPRGRIVVDGVYSAYVLWGSRPTTVRREISGRGHEYRWGRIRGTRDPNEAQPIRRAAPAFGSPKRVTQITC